MGRTEIHQPREVFEAAVFFAGRIAEITGISRLDAIHQYTGLYREVTGRQGMEGGLDPLWVALTAKIEALPDADAITQLLYDAYLQQPHSLYHHRANTLTARVFGALGYIYEPTSRLVRMHFFPTRSRVSALSSRSVEERRTDFRHLLLDVRATHPEAESVKSSTWLQNLPNYRSLFPSSFQARLKNIGGSTYLGIWGQFVKGDGSGNRERLEDFRAKLAQARSVDEAIGAFPFPVLEAVGPIQEFYKDYDLGAHTL